MAPNERFGHLVELPRRQSRAGFPSEHRDRGAKDLPSVRHDVDFASRLELDHRRFSPPPTPASRSASRARCVTSSTEPTALTVAILVPCWRYHASTGAV